MCRQILPVEYLEVSRPDETGVGADIEFVRQAGPIAAAPRYIVGFADFAASWTQNSGYCGSCCSALLVPCKRRELSPGSCLLGRTGIAARCLILLGALLCVLSVRHFACRFDCRKGLRMGEYALLHLEFYSCSLALLFGCHRPPFYPYEGLMARPNTKLDGAPERSLLGTRAISSRNARGYEPQTNISTRISLIEISFGLQVPRKRASLTARPSHLVAVFLQSENIRNFE